MEQHLSGLAKSSSQERSIASRGHAVFCPRRGALEWTSPRFREWLAVIGQGGADTLLHEVSLAMKQATTGEPTGSEFEIRVLVGGEAMSVMVYPFEQLGQAAMLLVLPSPLNSHREGLVPSVDPVTQLPDRRALDARLDALANSRGAAPSTAVLFVDLDGFKHVNDRQGHLVGDQVLATVAQRLSMAVREVDFIARFGGDEFVVLVEGIESEAKLGPLVERLRSAAQQQIETPSGRISLSASIGVALSSEGFSDPRQMLAAADARMYAQKRAAP